MKYTFALFFFSLFIAPPSLAISMPSSETSSNCLQVEDAAQVVDLGMSTALSGPNQYLGNSMLEGVQTRLKEANCSAYWRTENIFLQLHVMDDGYQPEQTEKNTWDLIEQHQIKAMVGNVGTPTANVSWPITECQEIVFFGAYTGSGSLRKPLKSYVFNYRASYEQEMEVIFDSLIRQGIRIHEVMFFRQDDDYGTAGIHAAEAVLKKRFNYSGELQQTKYARNSLSIRPALRAFIYKRIKPKAIIIIGAYKPSAEFIRFTHILMPETLFFNLSFSGASELARLLPGINDRVYITQVVPSWKDSQAGKFSNEVSFEGYTAADVLVKALASINGEMTSAALLKALQEQEKQTDLLEANTQEVKRADNQISDRVWLTVLQDGIWQYLNVSREKKREPAIHN